VNSSGHQSRGNRTETRFADKRGNGKRFERGAARPKAHREGSSEGRGRDYDRKVPETKFSDRKVFDRKAPETKFSDRKVSDRKAPETKFSDRKAPDRKAPDRKAPEAENRKSFGEGTVRKNYAEKKTTKKKSNAVGQRTERGEKKDRFSKDEGSKYAGQKSSFDKGRGKPAKKSKAATRVQAKRKAGAKPSSPMKKYVKIR
jgi:hypothetical protein